MMRYEAGAFSLLMREPDGPALLSDAQQTGIFQVLGLSASGDDGEWLDATCGQPVNPEIRLVDLDADGEGEVVVQYGNSCTSGMAGRSVAVFVRDVSGGHRPVLMVPGLIAEVLPSGFEGYSDLLIGGPGFCFAVWQWTGAEYAHLRNEPQTPGGCDGRSLPNDRGE